MLHANGECEVKYVKNTQVKVPYLIFVKDLHCFSSALCLGPISVKQFNMGFIFSKVSYFIWVYHWAISRLIHPQTGWNRNLQWLKWTTHFSLVMPSSLSLTARGPGPMMMKVQWGLYYPQALTEFFVSCLTWGSVKSKKIPCGFCTLLSVKVG